MTENEKLELQSVIDRCKTGGCSSVNSHAEIFKEVIDLVKPKNILEIGFFCGSSGNMLLELSKQFKSKLTSVDPFMDNPTNDYLHSVGRPEEIGGDSVQLAAVESVYQNYKDRFRFVHKRSLADAIDGDLSIEPYQLAYVDGCHWEPSVCIDLNICLALKIPFLLLDDYNEMYNGVRIALAKMKNRFAIIKQYTEQDGGADVMFIANLDIVDIKW
jgi:hypothetical protein